ncbi:hypothetical protein CROQUDRAFT_51944 [Cronartium quercuum f. sp. fusiforme G11]|uniref:Uncharacterized protein n=1 Tax=Cronartium quercuum f. sp. fusiforme G11 TaxID=708437 RepID=A0A9P6T8A2_9BASI|nr:hypothetical protein CROQUDRAFT_51944 [Cronartium quercuum f. sp. fusiforme G11]
MRGLLKDLDGKGGGRWSYLIGTESIISGAGAGLVSSIMTCPLDLVKTKLQAQGGLHVDGRTSYYKGLVGTIRIIWQEEGFRGLYRGLGPTIFGYLPTWAIYFTVYDSVKSKLIELSPNHREDVLAHVLAAMTAGATSTTATNPLWVIKTRFMTQRITEGKQTERYRHTYDAFRRIYAQEGLRGFYRGLVPSLFGVSHVAIQFPLYEQIKLYYKPAHSGDLPSSRILIASAFSKMLASVITYPHEVLRTRLQVHRLDLSSSHSWSQDVTTSNKPFTSFKPETTRSKLAYPRMSETFKHILKTEGILGFYHGMGVNLIRTVPNSALTILTYELLMRQITSMTRPRQT